MFMFKNKNYLLKFITCATMKNVAPLATTVQVRTTRKVKVTVMSLSATLAFLIRSVCCSEAEVASSSLATKTSHSLTFFTNHGRG
jgi:hypothetical protein